MARTCFQTEVKEGLDAYKSFSSIYCNNTGEKCHGHQALTLKWCNTKSKLTKSLILKVIKS